MDIDVERGKIVVQSAQPPDGQGPPEGPAYGADHRPIILAHRGASRAAPENSLAAFALALQQDADGIECDTQLTADGQVIILHDDTLDATTTGRGPARDHTLAEIRELRLRNRRGGEPTEERVPTLEETLARYGHGQRLMNVEIKPSKSTELAERVAMLVVAAQCQATVLLSSFDVRALAYLNDHYPILRRALLYPPSSITRMVVGLRGGLGWITTASALGCEAVHPNARLVHASMIERAHTLALNVNVWTVDDEKTIDTLTRLHVDGIITNEPAAARATVLRVASVVG